MLRRLPIVLGFVAILAAATPMRGVNDFWLGNRYSVSVFYLTQEKGIDPPRPKSVQMPDYPVECMRANVSGQALIEFSVSPAGAVRDVKVVRAEIPEFGETAKAAVKKWSFFPAMERKSGIATSVTMQCRFDFRVEEVPTKAKQ
jgi:TonB family protein